VRVTHTERRHAFCDASPRNLLIAEKLAEIFPEALFILTLRHYSGTIQSLLRTGMVTQVPGQRPSSEPGVTAAGAAELWSRYYTAARALPPDRTIVFGYDSFCANPDGVLARFKIRLGRADFPTAELDDRAFSASHASVPGKARRTVGRDSDGRLAPMSSYDRDDWTAELEATVRPLVAQVDERLFGRYPDDYASPPGYAAVL